MFNIVGWYNLTNYTKHAAARECKTNTSHEGNIVVSYLIKRLICSSQLVQLASCIEGGGGY